MSHGALDVEVVGILERHARLRRSSKTVIFATHYLEEADAYADRIVLMSHGRIVADGAPPRSKRRSAVALFVHAARC